MIVAASGATCGRKINAAKGLINDDADFAAELQVND